MIKKKLIYILIFFIISSCGYNPIYLKKNNSEFFINNIEQIGNKNINRKIISLVNLQINKNQKNAYNLTLSSNNLVETIAKDKSGDPTIFRTTVTVQLYLKDPIDESKVIKTKKFIANFVYKNMKNKFNLKQYQKSVQDNLINKISEEITVFINL